jgi:hypothetical protein
MDIYCNCGTSAETKCFAKVCRKGGNFTVPKEEFIAEDS